MSTKPDRAPAKNVRQVRLSDEVLARVDARCVELKMPVARYIAMCVSRSLGPVEGMDSLFKDLSALRDIEEQVRGA